MKHQFFKALAKINRAILPSYSTKDTFDLRKATTFQKAIIGYRSWVTKNAINQPNTEE